MSIAIIIVNYRTPALTIDCLASLAIERQQALQIRVILVDNASSDGSVEAIGKAVNERGWSDWVTVIAMDRNLGFAGGNNVGIGQVLEHEYILLLNSDTVVRPGTLIACQKKMGEDSGIGILSCLVLNKDGSVQNVARRLPNPLRIIAGYCRLPWLFPRLFGWANTEDPAWDRRTQARDVDWLGGAFMFCRGAMIRKIGGLDEDFFFYGEDVEFCHRAWSQGYRCHYSPIGSIIHYGGSSPDPSRSPSGNRSLLAWKARYVVQRKCYGRLAARLVQWVDMSNYFFTFLWVWLRFGPRHPRSIDLIAALRNIVAAS